MNFFPEVVHSMTWEKVIDGNIPKDAIGSFTPKIYFCKVYDEASVSALYVLDTTYVVNVCVRASNRVNTFISPFSQKQTFTGSIKEGENACQYVELKSGDIRFSDSSFQVNYFNFKKLLRLH